MKKEGAASDGRAGHLQTEGENLEEMPLTGGCTRANQVEKKWTM